MTTLLDRPAMERVVDRVLLDVILGLHPEEITTDAKIAEDLTADSLDVIEITLGLEEQLKIEIPDEDADRFPKMTVDQLVDYLMGKTAGVVQR